MAQKGMEMSGEKGAAAVEPLLLTKAEVAELLGVCERSVKRLLQRGVLTRLPVGLDRCTRIERAEVERWVREGCPSRPGWQGGGKRRR